MLPGHSSGSGSKPGNALIATSDPVLHLSPEMPDQPLHRAAPISTYQARESKLQLIAMHLGPRAAGQVCAKPSTSYSIMTRQEQLSRRLLSACRQGNNRIEACTAIHT